MRFKDAPTPMELDDAPDSPFDASAAAADEQKVTFHPQPSVTFVSPSSGGMRHLPSSIRRRLQSLADRTGGTREDKSGASAAGAVAEDPPFGRSCPSLMQTRSKSGAVRREPASSTPESPTTPDFSMSLPSSGFRKTRKKLRPPTPPLHQHAVWVSELALLEAQGGVLISVFL